MKDDFTIAIAGASGYIGRAMIPKLRAKFPQAHIVALSRSQQKSGDEQVVWRACDLFSMKSIADALPEKVDVAFYLVHSMAPTANLDQGSFADYDLILADNFARVLKLRSPQQLIYLGGLVPRETSHLSLHLQSRLEVEATFRAHNLPLVVFRAGLIIGEHGSSWQILLKLVDRLPVMLCPKWTLNPTTPVDLETVLDRLSKAVLDSGEVGKTHDLAGCQPLSYLQMMRETARRIGKRRLFIPVPFMTAYLSRLWVTLITRTPRNLVYPLVESLRHPMVAKGELPERQFKELLAPISLQTHASSGGSFLKFRAQRKTVRSVQRLPLPTKRDAEWVKYEYARWLPKYLKSFLRASVQEDQIIFSVAHFDLLDLQLGDDPPDADRQMLYIRKGVLVEENNRGRLEFRVVLGRKFLLAAIHDYRPSLPWFIYQLTQAKIHLFVMRAFARHLGSVKE